jgi:CRISPR-associated endonuclease/helicase Cas3
VYLSAEEAAYYVGLWHDLGKFHPDWQRYITAIDDDPNPPRRGPDHKASGTQLALEFGGPCACVIQGHHGGLRHLQLLQTWLRDKSASGEAAEALALARAAIPDLEPPGRISLPSAIEKNPFAAEFFLRMLFSALVDADFLDTERHFLPERARTRSSEAQLGDLRAIRASSHAALHPAFAPGED